MFGQTNPQDDNQIPDQSIDAAMGAPADQPAATPDPQAWQHPGQPISDAAPVITAVQGSQSSDPVAAQPTAPDEVVHPTDTPAPVAPDDSAAVAPIAPAPVAAGSDDLLDIKQQALGQLSPLVDHLDQSPEEKFRTTMMMIQASDNQALVRVAFEAAQQIPDEKARAQALLDVINEINYFTQPHPDAGQPQPES